MLIASARAYAKLNLTLEVVGRRPDGYHDLRSLVAAVDWYDDLRGWLMDAPGVELRCDRAELANRDNLVYLAACRLAGWCGQGGAPSSPRVGDRLPSPAPGRDGAPGRKPVPQGKLSVAPGLTIELRKRLPIGAGLGGGSSDAAATLAICNHLWDLGLSRDELAGVGDKIGSDVAVFFSLPRAVMAGRGELVEPVEVGWSGWAVLVSSGAVVSTAQVYGAWRPGDKHGRAAEALETALTAKSAPELSGCLFNDLEAAVFRVSPAVKQCFDRLQTSGFAGRVRVTGAGSVLYVLEDDRDTARAVAKDICDRNIGLAVRVVRVLKRETLVVREE